MPGMGPPPKDPSKRARKNQDAVQLRIVEVVATPQPELPSFTVQVTIEGELVSQEFFWPQMTRDWWSMLALHPLAFEFTDIDWSYLMDTARIHAAFWAGDLKLEGALRLREAAYGFTPADRARLRTQFALATDAEVTTARKVTSARERYKSLSAEG